MKTMMTATWKIWVMMMPRRRKVSFDRNFWNNFNDFVYYWRKNIHRFCEEYLGIRLHFFQKLLLYMMDAPYTKNLNTFIFFASRGLGKTFLTALFCACKCILYPGLQVRVASANTSQAKIMLGKIFELMDKYPLLKQEIKRINNRKDFARIIWKNGSVIETCVSGAGARGNRAHILVLDESRLMFKEDITGNLKPFLTGNRTPAFLSLDKKYKKYMEDEHNSILYLTSIGYKNEWSYHDFEENCNLIADGLDNYNVMCLPYQFGVEAGIITEDYIESQLRDSTTDMKIFKMEMDVIPYGESEHSLFDYSSIARLRKLHQPLYPITDSEYTISNGDISKSVQYIPKQPGEIRVLSFDIAYAVGRKNDNSVVTVFRLMENGEHYLKCVSYMEAMNGETIDIQAVRVKQLFYDLECDYAVVDAGGPGGIAMLGVLGAKTLDPVRGIRYPGWRTFDNNPKFDTYVADNLAEPVMFCMQSNTNIQYSLKTIMDVELERNNIMFLLPKKEVEDELNEKYNYMKYATSNSPYEREKANRLIVSFENTTAMIDEAINTKLVRLPSGRYAFDEGTGRKDRIICVMYGVYFITMYLEKDLSYQKRAGSMSEYFNRNSSYRAPTNPFAGNLDKLRGFGGRR